MTNIRFKFFHVSDTARDLLRSPFLRMGGLSADQYVIISTCVDI